MRDYLFRGKRIDNGEWVEGSLCLEYYQRYGVVMIAPSEDEIFKVDPSTVGQYTGMTDKNGKKIFEGDILSIAQNSDGMGQYYYPPIPYPAHVVVRWDLCSWMWEVIGKDKYYLSFPDAWCHYDCEVIGNIYDNPELLEEKR